MRWIFLTLLLLNLLVLEQQLRSDKSSNEDGQESAPELTEKHYPRLMLLEEKLGQQPQISAAPASSTTDWNQVSTQGCLAIGPYSEGQKAQRSLDILAQQGWNARIRHEDVRRVPDYWVYLEPFGNREQAIEMLRKLQQEYKVDSFLISQGPLENGISLGLFKAHDAAKALQHQRIKQGLEARLAEVERMAVEYWVVLDSKYSQDMLLEAVRLLEKQGIHQEGRMISCKGIASDLILP